MNEKKIMKIVSDDGSSEEVEVVIYTKNERDEDNNITIYVSNVDRSNGETKLLGVETEEEWNRIKDVLRELAKSE